MAFCLQPQALLRSQRNTSWVPPKQSLISCPLYCKVGMPPRPHAPLPRLRPQGGFSSNEPNWAYVKALL